MSAPSKCGQSHAFACSAVGSVRAVDVECGRESCCRTYIGGETTRCGCADDASSSESWIADRPGSACKTTRIHARGKYAQNNVRLNVVVRAMDPTKSCES